MKLTPPLAALLLLQLLTAGQVAAQSEHKTVAEARKALASCKADTNRVNAIMELGQAYFSEPGFRKNKIDSMFYLANEAEHLSDSLRFFKGKGNAMVLRAITFRLVNNKPRALAWANEAIPVFMNAKAPNDLAETYKMIAWFYDNEGEKTLKMGFYQKALSIYKTTGNKDRIARLSFELGEELQHQGKYSESLEYVKSALAIYLSIGHKNLPEVYHALCQAYQNVGNPVGAIKYGLLSVDLAEGSPITKPDITISYLNLGKAYYTLSKYQQCSYYYDKAVLYAKKFRDTADLKAAYFTRIIVSTDLQQYSKALKQTKVLEALEKNPSDEFKFNTDFAYARTYLHLKDYQKAWVHINSMKTIADRLNWPSLQQRLKLVLVAYYRSTKQFKLSYSYLTQYVKEEQKGKSILKTRNAEQEWFKVDSAAGNLKSALQHYQAYKAMSDSILNKKKTEQMNKFEIQYKVDQKNRELVLNAKNIALLKKQAATQKKLVDKTLMLRNVLIGGSVLLLILVALLYNRYRIKTRSNRLLKLQRNEIDQQNLSLVKLNSRQQGLLNDKEMLLREIHHRVKNNLQITISLLSMQSAYIDNDIALETIRNSQYRMHAMSLIHQKLYQSSELTSINMADYIRELGSYLMDSFSGSGAIAYEYCLQPLELDIAQSIPLGLIINEAITNAFKYAFPNRCDGVISIFLQHVEGLTWTLMIRDNGIGINKAMVASPNSSLGMNLMHGLAIQLDGEFMIERNNGTQVTICFNKGEPVINDDSEVMEV